MDVSSVKTPAVQAAHAPKRPDPAQQAKHDEYKPRPVEAKRQEEAKPPPVVNTQGQTTGRLLNVTA